MRSIGGLLPDGLPVGWQGRVDEYYQGHLTPPNLDIRGQSETPKELEDVLYTPSEWLWGCGVLSCRGFSFSVKNVVGGYGDVYWEESSGDFYCNKVLSYHLTRLDNFFWYLLKRQNVREIARELN